MSEESNLTKCKVCQEIKMRIQDGMFDHKNKRWVNEQGLLWNGKVCADCHKQKQAELKRLRSQAVKK